MATATSKSRPSKRRIAAYIAFGIVVIAVIWLAFNLAELKGNAKLGSAYAAHITCSCRYIEGRSLTDCAKDMEAGMEIVSVSDDPENKRVTASVAFLAEAVAELRGKSGCLNLNEAEIEALG